MLVRLYNVLGEFVDSEVVDGHVGELVTSTESVGLGW